MIPSKTTIIKSAISLLLIVPLVAFANKIAVIEIQQIFAQAEVAIEIRQQLQAQFQPQQKRLSEQQTEFETKVKRYEKNRLTLSAEENSKQQQQLRQAQQQLQQLSTQLQQQLNQAQQQNMQRVEDLVEASVAKVAKKQDISLVLYQGVAYFQPQLDITDAVIKDLNDSFNAASEKTE